MSQPSYLRRVLFLFLGVVGFVILANLAVWAFSAYGFRSYEIVASSMETTILKGEQVYVDKRTYRSREPRRGELVVHLIPGRDERIEKVARVVAVPGDRVEIADKTLLLNGQPQDEPYAIHQDPFIMPGSPQIVRDNFGPFVVPSGHYFMLGDNRDYSLDSRFHGPVERSLITGGPRMWIYWSRDEEKGQTRWDRIGRTLH
jgi:signal peptidase I